ncbi:TonB-dependent receptor [Chryseotalea sanaruensis]|uniref:TonB-dependent receptor n=1 Tax=Chryseotalea sanaruensis TaxID=2482724 RepID=A0A401U9L0_9BACT|nr:TonB-dependent receptor [Chryseotalea sanaruensis]GCC51569.1 TonB-dependent receptor [Chryseotalea sanaruensis]
MKNILGIAVSFLLLLSLTDIASAQSGTISGKIKDANTQEALIGVSVVIEGSNPIIGTSSDIEGNYKLTAPTGSYTLKATFVGYREVKKYNVVLTSGNIAIINFELQEELTTLNEIVVKAGKTAAVATLETPLSIQKLSTEEIKSNPGGNFDISRVIQSLPGVGGGTGGTVRNDIIIRGGAPNENVFYLDGIEVPIINHFTTQGSSGGPQGILNVSFIEDVTLSTSAFNARYDNPLSSVFQFKQRDGNSERIQGNIRLSGTELATTFDGPISSKTTFLASARRSYLQAFFKLIDLPIRPSYWDFQYKVTHKFNAKTSLTAIGIGAIDEFSFAVPKESTPEKEYTLRSNPFINQNSYTLGFALKHLLNNGYLNVSVSRNYLDNRLDKFEDGNNGDESLRTLKTRSDEIENKLRIDVNKSIGAWKYAYGAMFQYVQFKNDVFSVLQKELRDESDNLIQPQILLDFNTELDFLKYGAFFQTTRSFFNNRFSVSGGVRTDMNSFTDDGNNPLETLSPRVSLSYAINNQWNVNASVGSYYKIPIYTVLGYQNTQGDYINRSNKYIQSDHYVGGVEFLPNESLRFTLEGFYKSYSNYPVSISRGISLANEGASFGAIGNEAVTSTGEGRSLGIELFAQKKLTKSLFYVLAYTYYKSEFAGTNGVFVPSSWDNQHLVSALLGKKLKKGWELGLKFRYAGGAPYTPFDLEASRANYLSQGVGVRDLALLNTQRLNAFNQVDLRVDKKWNYKQFTFDLYLDVQNAFRSATPQAAEYTFERNTDGSYTTTDGLRVKQDGSNAIPLLLDDDSPFFVPTIGFIIEF